MSDPLVSSAWRTYFSVGSKEGGAALQIHHPAAKQGLILPVYPSDAVTEALPLLTPAFAHYAAQWPRVMVPDVEEGETDTRGFYVEASTLPPGPITDPTNQQVLSDMAKRHMQEDARRFFGDKPVPALILDMDVARVLDIDFLDSICVNVKEAGIEPYRWRAPH